VDFWPGEGIVWCEQSQRLLQEYRDAVSKWSRLTENASILNLRALAEALPQDALDAKKAYSDHRIEHGC
jgi:hypothetical protein